MPTGRRRASLGRPSDAHPLASPFDNRCRVGPPYRRRRWTSGAASNSRPQRSAGASLSRSYDDDAVMLTRLGGANDRGGHEPLGRLRQDRDGDGRIGRCDISQANPRPRGDDFDCPLGPRRRRHGAEIDPFRRDVEFMRHFRPQHDRVPVRRAVHGSRVSSADRRQRSWCPVRWRYRATPPA